MAITLGKTTKSEIAKLGHRTKSIDERTRQPYPLYVVRGINFWYDEESNVVGRLSIYHDKPLPKPWQELGFQWQKSYSDCLSLLKELGYSIKKKKRGVGIFGLLEDNVCPNKIMLNFLGTGLFSIAVTVID